MKTFIALLLFSTAVIAIGAMEDPCTTEGLPSGCIERNSNQ
jgi:hypothetical protein